MATMLGLISEHPSGQEASTTFYHNTLLYTQLHMFTVLDMYKAINTVRSDGEGGGERGVMGREGGEGRGERVKQRHSNSTESRVNATEIPRPVGDQHAQCTCSTQRTVYTAQVKNEHCILDECT